jgi:phage-related protein
VRHEPNDDAADEPPVKPVRWVGSSRDDLKKFPEDVKDEVGFALFTAQRGGKHPAAKPLKGFGSTGVVEIVEGHDGDTYRAVYTVQLAGTVYVLHAFQKKSMKGKATPKRDIQLIKTRLTIAQQHHKANPPPSTRTKEK